MQHDDFVNWTPEKCKQRIHEWQKTRDKDLFSLLLARYDKFLLKLAWKYHKQFYGVSVEDLYHSAIVGFGEALVQFKNQAPTRLIMAVIKAYVKNEIDSRYMNKHGYEVSSFERTNKEEPNPDDVMDANFILNSSFLSEKERAFLRLRFEENMTFKAIGTKFNISEQATWQKYKKIISKIQRELKKEGK